jgi:predicted lipoprotein
MTHLRRLSRGWVVLTTATLAWLGLARPWTILPIGREQAGPFDAAAYVESIWHTRVRPAMVSNAVALEFYRDAAASATTPVGPAAVVVEGRVLEVNTSSRVGIAAIDLNPGDGRADATIQIGPVLRGTALRDTLEFIRFTDFTNQIEFAAVASALNQRVVVDVLGGIDFGTLVGRQVRAVGAASLDRNTAEAPPSVVPVEFTVADRP